MSNPYIISMLYRAIDQDDGSGSFHPSLKQVARLPY